MSSLKAARADNFYHPPDWDPRKESRAEYATAGQPKWKAHPLRERAKKLDEGILVIRFEMPYDVRCAGCGCRIGKGVRYDAEKKAVGKYLSTKIWSFRMLCKAEEEGNARCDQRRNPHFIEIHTDPKNAEYVIVEGAQRVGETMRTAEELGVETLDDPAELAARAANPFYKLEHTKSQPAEAKRRRVWQAELEERQDAVWRDDYAASQSLRATHRERRRRELHASAEAEAKGIRVPLVEEHAADVAAAAAVGFRAKKARSDAVCGEKRLRLLGGSIFGSDGGGGGGGGSSRKDDEERRLQLMQLRQQRGMLVSTKKARAPSGAEGKRPAALLVATAPSRALLRTPESTVMGTPESTELGSEHGASRLPTPAPVGLVAYSDSESEG